MLSGLFSYYILVDNTYLFPIFFLLTLGGTLLLSDDNKVLKTT